MATSGEPAAPAAQAPAAATPTPAPAASTGPKARVGATDELLTGVLDDLVAKGTLSEAQKQAVLDGVVAERTERQAARKAAREQARADWKQLREFLADGVITKAEFDKLPADSPMRKVTTLMDDGKITTEELKELGRGMFFGGMSGKNGRGGAWGGWGKGPNKATPSASPSTGG
jgi:polyhydroxyalkanoate synthesis regulator phasin